MNMVRTPSVGQTGGFRRFSRGRGYLGQGLCLDLLHKAEDLAVGAATQIAEDSLNEASGQGDGGFRLHKISMMAQATNPGKAVQTASRTSGLPSLRYH